MAATQVNTITILSRWEDPLIPPPLIFCEGRRVPGLKKTNTTSEKLRKSDSLRSFQQGYSGNCICTNVGWHCTHLENTRKAVTLQTLTLKINIWIST